MDEPGSMGLSYLSATQSPSDPLLQPPPLPVPTSPAYSPPWSPWCARPPGQLASPDDIRPEDSISAAPSPAHQPSSETSVITTIKGAFRFLFEDEDDDDDSTTVVPNRPHLPSGVRSPSHESQVSEESYFSCSNLPEHDPHRRISASDLRIQTKDIPATVVPRRQGYPHHFSNIEDLPLANPPPLIEHPVTPDGSYIPGDDPGPARIVTNRWDRSNPEAIYHDPTKPPVEGGRHSPFSKAEYRGKDRMTPTGLEGGFGNFGFGR